MRTQAYLDMMALFKASDIANLDGEFVDCGHVLMPYTTASVGGKTVKTFTYPDNYTSKTPMYFEKLGDK